MPMLGAVPLPPMPHGTSPPVMRKCGSLMCGNESVTLKASLMLWMALETAVFASSMGWVIDFLMSLNLVVTALLMASTLLEMAVRMASKRCVTAVFALETMVLTPSSACPIFCLAPSKSPDSSSSAASMAGMTPFTKVSIRNVTNGCSAVHRLVTAAMSAVKSSVSVDATPSSVDGSMESMTSFSLSSAMPRPSMRAPANGSRNSFALFFSSSHFSGQLAVAS